MHRSPSVLRRSAPVLVAAGAVAAGLAAVELLHRAASRTGFPRRPVPAPGGPDVVLVLGCPSRADGSLHPLQRWRVDIAVRSRASARTRLVVSGGGPAGRASEAAVMGRYAQARGVPRECVVLEARSTSTWENVVLSIPLLEGARTIAVASSPTHGARARRYLRQQRPDLAARLVPADDFRLGERPVLKVTTLAYGVARAVHRRVLPFA